MTTDEALEAICGLDTRDLRESVRIRETITALVAAAEERGRAEGVAACVESARTSMETLTRLLGRHNDAVLVMQACIDTWSAGRGLTDECAGALHRLLAAHGREAAAAERERLRRAVEPVHEAIQCAMSLVLPTPPIAGDRSMAYETLENADSKLAAALREASTTVA